MSDEATDLDVLESQLPPMSREATKMAYRQALAAGQSVMEAEDGVIYETFPDGTRRIVKNIARPVPLKNGRKFTIR